MKKTLIIIIAIMGIAAVWHAVGAAPRDVYGYACSRNIGCFSLNSDSSVGQADYTAQPSSFHVQFDTSANEFMPGSIGWSPVVGVINFGVACPMSVSSIVSGASSGNKCATVPLVTGSTTSGGWSGIVYVGDVHVTSGAVTFTGQGWEGLDTDIGGQRPSDTGIGWLDFSHATLDPSVIPVTCGSAAGTIVTAAPTVGLCSDASSPAVSSSSTGIYSWTCGSNTCTATDQAFVATCDVNATTIPTSTIPSPLCAPGSTAGPVTGVAPGPYTWTCTNNPDVAYCSSVVPGSGGGSSSGVIKPVYKEN